MPLVSTAEQCPARVAKLAHPAVSDTSVGMVTADDMPPMPSQPSVFSPQAYRLPSLRIANEVLPAANTETNTPATAICVNALTGEVVPPVPHCPAVFMPVAHSVPSDLSASVWVPAHDTAAQSVALPICVSVV